MTALPPSASLAEDEQILGLEQVSGSWLKLLPQNVAPLASFYHPQRAFCPPCYLPSETSDSEEERLRQFDDKSSIRPDGPNVKAAAVFIHEFLRREWPTGEFAIAGGFAMILHGSARTTRDVNICADGKSRKLPLIPMLMNQRFILQSTRRCKSMIQFYVKTGPSFGDTICQIDRAVKVELVLLGNFRAPMFKQHTVLLPYRGHNLRTLDTICLLKSKLAAFGDRGGDQDYVDVKYLIQVNESLIRSQKRVLDLEYVRLFIHRGMEGSFHEQPEAIQQAKAILVHP